MNSKILKSIGNSYKRTVHDLQYMAFYNTKDGLLLYKRPSNAS